LAAHVVDLVSPDSSPFTSEKLEKDVGLVTWTNGSIWVDLTL